MAEYNPATFLDPDELKANAFDFLRDNVPGWEPADGNLDVWLIEAFAEMVSPLVETANDVPRAVFLDYGANLAALPAGAATQATGTVTIVVIDTTGYEVPEGATFAFDADGELVAFQTLEPTFFAEGVSSVAGVTVQAVEPGALGSGLTGTATLIDPFDFVVSITLEAQTTGGLDGEDEEDYLDRLADELRLLTPRPILPEDFATLARRVPEVDRALAVDGYNLTTATSGQERCVTVYVVNDEGEAVSGAGITAVDTLLQGEREVTFLVFVGTPTYQAVNVVYSVTAWPDFDKPSVKAACDVAIAAYVHPRDWGQPTFGDQRGWASETKVRHLEVAQVLQSIEGVRYVDTLTLNGSAADVTLTGVVVLPTLGTLTGAVT